MLNSFADLLRLLRRKEGWSAQEMGEHLGVSGRTVEGWEQGRGKPDHILALIRLCWKHRIKP